MKPARPTPETPTEILVALAREGAADAFELLVERHRLRLFATAMRYTRNYDDAADACQEALARAWERLDTLQDSSRFGSWIEQIVVHQSLDARRRSFARQRMVVSIDRQASNPVENGMEAAASSPLPGQAQKPESPQESILRQEIAAHLLRAIESLPETLRQAAYLRHIEGLRGEQIAARLNISLDAAKKRVARATLDLRRRLQALYDELLGPGAS